ncbi:MAG: DNA-binding NtrC family response regulator [Myxococcota bacterium]|jgi:DNA-binding NtrC family response regulator
MIRLLGRSALMEALRERLARVAATPLPVLVTGETGTGKEVAARLLHELSGRSGPFVPVDCSALSRSLVETELFGHERGAFTGADQRRRGLVSEAEGGTFFLDELGELPLETQTRLLRLLEQGTYRMIGSVDQRRADIRIVAATWRDLGELVRAGSFRADLYHRLTGVNVTMPPLRHRGEDVLLLLRDFLAEAARENGRPPPRITPRALAHLRAWPWPGNVRELKNVARYLAAMTPGAEAGIDDLPDALRRAPPRVAEHGAPAAAGHAPPIRIDLAYMEARRVYLDAFQDAYVTAILDAHAGNVSAAARAAGMDRRSIQRVLARSRKRRR